MPQLSRLARNALIAFAVLVLLQLTFHPFRSNTGTLRIQNDFSLKSSPSKGLRQNDRLEVVESEFMHAWSGYKHHAWLSDSLKPVSADHENNYCGWAATLVDSLDSLFIMGFKHEFENAVETVLKIDFQASTKTCTVNFFESTIRYLGGLLAAYDLSQDQRLLKPISELGSLLHKAFNTTSGMPCNHCHLDNSDSKLVQPSSDVPLADGFSFSLEFMRLALVTGDMKYLDRVMEVSDVFRMAQNKSSLPGLWPERIDFTQPKTEAFLKVSNHYSMGALSDSAYEYLVKSQQFIGGADTRFAEMWKRSSAAIKDNLLFRAYFPESDKINTLFVGLATVDKELNITTIEPRIEHLACFSGGIYALSSRLFDNPEDLAIGRMITVGCAWAYHNAPNGIMPETISLLPCTDANLTQCAWDQLLWDNTDNRIPTFPDGFLESIDPHYGLRPEAVESLFVLYRITGEEIWRDLGWEMFQSIIRVTRTPYGHAGIANVMQQGQRNLHLERHKHKYGMKAMAIEPGPSLWQQDQMETFWLAETLKYFYLLFDDANHISLDEYVLNTEAHPLKLTKGLRATRPYIEK